MNAHSSGGVRLRGIVVLIIFAFLGVGPIPLTSTLGLFIVIFRPKWFKKFVDLVYAGKGR